MINQIDLFRQKGLFIENLPSRNEILNVIIYTGLNENIDHRLERGEGGGESFVDVKKMEDE